MRVGKPGRRSAKAAWTDVWRDVARRSGGRVMERRFRPPLVELRRDPWRTLVDLIGDTSGSGSPRTRLRTPYRAERGFRFRLRKRGPLEVALGWVGAGGVRIGRAEFDRRFHLTASGTGHVRSLLLGTRLGERLLETPEVSVDLKRPGRRRRRMLGEGTRDAVVVLPRVLTEEDELRDAFDLSIELVRELERIGLARPLAEET